MRWGGSSSRLPVGTRRRFLIGLSLLYALGPIVLKLGAVALMWSFPLGAEVQRDLRRLIELGA